MKIIAESIKNKEAAIENIGRDEKSHVSMMHSKTVMNANHMKYSIFKL